MLQGLIEGHVAEKCALPAVSEEGVKEREVREGTQVVLSSFLPCNVSFVRGQERSVHFAIIGLPEVGPQTLHFCPQNPAILAAEPVSLTPCLLGC
jgi:hypothetical protein